MNETAEFGDGLFSTGEGPVRLLDSLGCATG